MNIVGTGRGVYSRVVTKLRLIKYKDNQLCFFSWYNLGVPMTFSEDCSSLHTLKCHIALDCCDVMSSLTWIKFVFLYIGTQLCLVFSVSVEDCKFMDSKMRPLFLVFKNWDDLGDLVRVIFKNGDGECVTSFDCNVIEERSLQSCSQACLSRNTPSSWRPRGRRLQCLSIDWYFTLGLK